MLVNNRRALHILSKLIHSNCSVLIGRFGQHYGKFLASVATKDIIATKKSFHQLSEGAKNGVASIVPKHVVETLEVIYINENYQY